MSRYLGMDEAGYGPLLGPMVIGQSYFADEATEPTMPIRPDPKLRIGDSKEILARRDGLAAIEAVVLGVHAATRGSLPTTLADWLDLDPNPNLKAELATLPWYRDLDLPLPFAADADRVARAWEAVEKGQLLSSGRPSALALRILPESQLNRQWEQTENKHDSLFVDMMELLEVCLATAPMAATALRVSIDKLGGRSYYEPKLIAAFPFRSCEILNESRAESRYLMGLDSGETEFRFLMKGDSKAAEIALASMLAKYSREALMRVFNDHFQRLVPNLRPTAGYYEDGRRFLADLDRAGHLSPELATALKRQR